MGLYRNLAIFKLRTERGRMWTYTIREIILVSALIKIFNLPSIFYYFFPVLIVLFWLGIGYWDEKKAKIWQIEAAYSSKELNPVFEKIGSDIDHIKESINRNGTDEDIFAVITRLKDESHMMLSDSEALCLYNLVKKTGVIGGDIAEVGVYKGGSARIICVAKERKKNLYLFDTFEGNPTPSKIDDNSRFYQGQYKSSFIEVKKYLSNCPNVFITKGIFPESAGMIKDKTFSFVHLDVDVYKSSIESLGFFYPRMTRGGIILSHDYSTSRGVRVAFQKFFADKPEKVIELSDSQCIIVKV